MLGIRINIIRVCSVIAGGTVNRREELGAVLSVQVELIMGVELYPVDLDDLSGSSRDKLLHFAICFSIEITCRAVSSVPNDHSCCKCLV